MSGPLQMFFDWRQFWTLFGLILLGDLILNVIIVRFIPYTEIDWVAYMEEVAGYLKENQLDYSQLRGQTGPLVYPGGFVWIFSALYYLTDEGDNILRGQYIFIGLHSAFLALLLLLYRRAGQGLGMPPWSLILLCLSRRIHSIFVLRLFNDCIAMFFLYAAVLMFTRYRWVLGSLLFTMALSVKMNILLFMPPLLVIMVMSCGWVRTVGYLVLMAAFQVLVGVPFLMHDAWAYLSCSFNFSRQFIYFWSVNWQMVPEDIFLSKPFSDLLLGLHLGTLVILGFKWCRPEGGVFPVLLGKQFSTLPKGQSTLRLNPSFMVFLLFSGNFAGIAFSRSLHYQFYVWYYHTLPALLWCTPFPTPIRLLLLALIELVWNVYPAQAWSSSLLLGCHMVLLLGVLIGRLPPSRVQAPVIKKKSKRQ